MTQQGLQLQGETEFSSEHIRTSGGLELRSKVGSVDGK